MTEHGLQLADPYELRRKTSNRARNAGWLLTGIAACIAVALGVPAYKESVRNQEAFNRQAICRQLITTAVAANGLQLQADQAKALLSAVEHGTPDSAAITLTRADTDRASMLAEIQAHAVDLCKADPDYIIPKELWLP